MNTAPTEERKAAQATALNQSVKEDQTTNANVITVNTLDIDQED